MESIGMKTLKLITSGLAVLFIIFLWAATSRQGFSAPQNVNSPQGIDSSVVLFEAKCAQCHGKDGRAKTFAGKLKHARNFTDAGWQESVTDEQLINSVKNGKAGMPAFGKKLTDEQITGLVSYVRNFKNTSAKK
jgi:mono/diheme cytochrome c family protein